MKWHKDIKGKSKQELVTILEVSHKSLKDFRFAISGSKQKNVREGRELRRKIARIKTLSHE